MWKWLPTCHVTIHLCCGTRDVINVFWERISRQSIKSQRKHIISCKLKTRSRTEDWGLRIEIWERHSLKFTHFRASKKLTKLKKQTLTSPLSAFLKSCQLGRGQIELGVLRGHCRPKKLASDSWEIWIKKACALGVISCPGHWSIGPLVHWSIHPSVKCQILLLSERTTGAPPVIFDTIFAGVSFRQHCRLSICSYFGWVWQILRIWVSFYFRSSTVHTTQYFTFSEELEMKQIKWDISWEKKFCSQNMV